MFLQKVKSCAPVQKFEIQRVCKKVPHRVCRQVILEHKSDWACLFGRHPGDIGKVWMENNQLLSLGDGEDLPQSWKADTADNFSPRLRLNAAVYWHKLLTTSRPHHGSWNKGCLFTGNQLIWSDEEICKVPFFEPLKYAVVWFRSGTKNVSQNININV